eukprot:2129516-Alexandrium_andersonii.AAC.1
MAAVIITMWHLDLAQRLYVDPCSNVHTASGSFSPARNCFKQVRAVSGSFGQFRASPEAA